jgi:hypothetical protein
MKYIIGIGTGRCGTRSLATLLANQEDTRATHEGYVMPWQTNPHYLESYICWLTRRGKEAFQVDVGFYMLPYVESLAAILGEVKFVVMQRTRQGVVDSYERWVPELNHWQAHRGDRWKRSAWDEAYPKFRADSRKEALGLYWDYYRKQTALISNRLPGRVLFVDVEALNDFTSRQQVLSFCGYANPRNIPIHVNRGLGCPPVSRDE